MFYCCLFGVLHFKLDYWGACLRWVRLVSGETILQAKTTPIVGGARTQVLAGHWGKRAKPLRHHCLLSLFMLILNYLSVVLTCWVERCVVAVAKTCLSLTYDEEQILHYELPADLLDRFKDINNQNFDPYNMEYGVNRWTAQLLVCVLYSACIVWEKLGLRQSWFLVLLNRCLSIAVSIRSTRFFCSPSYYWEAVECFISCLVIKCLRDTNLTDV